MSQPRNGLFNDHSANGDAAGIPSSPMTLVLQQLSNLAGQLGPAVGLDEPLHVSIQAGGIVLTLSIRAAACEASSIDVPASASPAREGNRPLGPSHRRVLAKATTTPVTARALIRAAGYSVNSWSRQLVQDLVRWRILLHLPEGYCLPGNLS